MLPQHAGLSESLSRLTLGKRTWSAEDAPGAASVTDSGGTAGLGADDDDGTKRSRGVSSFDEFMRDHGDVPASAWALTVYDEKKTAGDRHAFNGNAENGDGRGTSGATRGGDTSLLQTILNEEMRPHRSQSLRDAREAELFRQSYVAPEQNALQIIVHPDASASASSSKGDALLRSMSSGFLLQASRQRRRDNAAADVTMETAMTAAGGIDDDARMGDDASLAMNQAISSLHNDDDSMVD